MPQRVANGIDTRLMNIILAVLEKRLNFHLGQQDVFLNIVGGFRAQEPSIGLAVAMAVLSSLKNRELDRRDLFMGEVGLSGEIRNIPFLEKRIEEAAKLGFRRAFVPGKAESLKKKELEIIPCTTIHELAGKAFP
jgi:DNA repair protein RadA/Sms